MNQLCFARWTDGNYYPAVTGEVLPDRVRVGYLDNTSGLVRKDEILDLQEAFRILEFQGRYRHGLLFYSGVISQHDMIMNYDDGDVELVELRQLRGRKRGE